MTKTVADEDVVVHRYTQPDGQAGVRYSLDQVAEFASEGRFEPRVISWATHQLALHNFPTTELGKAKAIHEGILRDICWIPDPVDSELIRNPKYMLPDPVTGEPAMFPAGDCDDITTAELAAMMAVGVRAAVLGHSYEDDEQIGHVLGEIWDGKGKCWHFVDGSSRKLNFGQAFDPTHSRRIELPTKLATCDTSGQCPIGTPPSIPGDNIQFVGLAGSEPARGRQTTVGDSAMPAGGAGGSAAASVRQFDPALLADDRFEDGFDVYLTAAVERADKAWSTLVTVHDGARAALKKLGLTVSSPAVGTYWTQAEQQRLMEAGVKNEILSQAVRDVIAGTRTAQPVGPPQSQDLGFSLLPADEVMLVEDAQGLISLVNRDNSPHVLVDAPSGALSGIKWAQQESPVIGTALMLKVLTQYFVEVRHYLELQMQHFLNDQELAATEARDPFRQHEVLAARDVFQRAVAKARGIENPPVPQQSYGKALGDTMKFGVFALGTAAGLIALARWSDSLRKTKTK